MISQFVVVAGDQDRIVMLAHNLAEAEAIGVSGPNPYVCIPAAFLAYTVLPDGSTVSEKIGEGVTNAYLTQTMPVLELGRG
jgi:hypothetical protein